MTTIPQEDELKDEITSIIYGADWKERDIANAFKPDVEAAMHLITQQVTQARLEEVFDVRGLALIENEAKLNDYTAERLTELKAQLAKETPS